jgi:outer membrane receptor for ferrienterochelin and colicins
MSLFWAASVFARPAAAQDGAASQTEPSRGACPPGSSADCRASEVVVVGTRTPESVQRSTIRTGVVTREEADRRGARNVGEALAGETSLQVNPEAYGYLGRPSALQMQGLDAASSASNTSWDPPAPCTARTRSVVW